MSIPSTILVTSASGHIGSHLAPLLLSQKPQPKLVLPTSNADKLKSAIPSISNSTHNVLVEEGSVVDPVWFQSLISDHHVDTVFLCLTGTDELFTAINCLDAISRAGTVKRLVYLSITGNFTSESGFQEAVRTRGYPHGFAKMMLEQRLKHAEYDFKWTVLGPTLFFDNDIMQKGNLLEKSEMHTLFERGVNKISLPDIALAVRNAMYDAAGTWNRKKVMLGSKYLYTGSELVNIWSKALGKPLTPFFATKESLEAFEQQLRMFMPTNSGKASARNLRILFEFLMTYGVSMSSEEYDEQVRLLGKEPDDYETWVKETAESWNKN